MKNEYKFTLDEKVTVWNRKNFCIEAETKEEAEKIALELVKNAEDIDFYHSEYVFESEELIEPQANNGYATIVLMSNNDRNSKVMYENDSYKPLN